MRSIPIALLSLGMVNSVLLGFGAMANFKEWWNQRSRLQKTFLGAAFILSGLYALGFTVQLLTPAPATVTSTPVAPAPVVTQSLPQQAAKAAMQAATLTQIAASEPQWQQVVDGWKQAIDLLSQVPDGSVYRVEAENKISEYQKNLAYAQQRLEMVTPSAGANGTGVSRQAVVANGIGVSRQAVQSVFEEPSINFRFEASTPVDGQPRVMGKSPNGLAVVELIGQPANLTSASIMVGIPNDDAEARQLSVIHAMGFLKTTAPQWTGATDWLTTSVQQIASGSQTEATTTYGSNQVRLSIIKDMGLMTVTIKPQ
jgi:hypothetical protein